MNELIGKMTVIIPSYQPDEKLAEMKKYFSKLIKDDDPNVKLMREVFEAQEEFLSLK